MCVEKAIIGHSFRRSGEQLRVGGFSYGDTYVTMVTKAVKSLFPGKSTDGVVIVVGTGCVPDTLRSGPDTEWTLGGYLMEIGGLSRKNRTIFGFYRPDSEDEDEVYIGCTHSIKFNPFDDLFFFLLRRQ